MTVCSRVNPVDVSVDTETSAGKDPRLDIPVYMVRGDGTLGVAGRLRLSALYLDEAPDLDCGQLFARFDAA